MRVIIAGAGSIGKRHAGNLRSMGYQNLAFLRRVPETVNGFPETHVYDQLEEAITGPGDLIMVCNPSPFHLDLASRAIDHLCHVFIEKPISNNWNGIEAFIRKAGKSRSLTWVGYDLRFDIGLQHVKRWIDSGEYGRPLSIRIHVGQYLPDWRPEQDYAESITAREELGGGVLLELSHELDYALWLLGSMKSVAGITGNVDLNMNAENIALALLEFESGVLGSVHLDCLQRSMSRNCQVICSDAVIHWDFCAQSAWVSGPENRVLNSVTWNTEDRNVRFCRELAHVMACINGNEQPLVAAAEGAESLRLVLAIKEAASSRKSVYLSEFLVT